MYIDTSLTKARGKVYKRVLLRTSYREDSKVKHKTIANLSDQPEEIIEAIRVALKNKHEINQFLIRAVEAPDVIQGPSIGALYALKEVAKRLGIVSALGNSEQGKLALWQILARVIAQGSRLSAVRLASHHAVCDLLNLEPFTEDALYNNLEWLATHQEEIEKKLFKHAGRCSLFLYDVTSSYTEGQTNAYAAYGYNRDKKKSKKQIVIGLLTDSKGDPVSVQVFRGNTADSATFVEQVYKVQEKFGVENVIWVGDRGMIKTPQINQAGKDFQYITALTKPQILTLLSNSKITIKDFSGTVKEISDDKLRYILRRNPVRAEEIAQQRQDKLRSLQERVVERNSYLKQHPKAQLKTALSHLCSYAKKLKIHQWARVEHASSIRITIDKAALAQESLLDGCYVIKTNVMASTETSSEIVHQRYKDLSQVEWAFRTMKTSHLEIRPYYVRKEASTEGHVLTVMLAYKLVRALKEAWKDLEITVEEGIAELAGVHSFLQGLEAKHQHIPQPSASAKELLDALDLHLPVVLPFEGKRVATRKKLVKERQIS